jgi:hypothetical protein
VSGNDRGASGRSGVNEISAATSKNVNARPVMMIGPPPSSGRKRNQQAVGTHDTGTHEISDSPCCVAGSTISLPAAPVNPPGQAKAYHVQATQEDDAA